MTMGACNFVELGGFMTVGALPQDCFLLERGVSIIRSGFLCSFPCLGMCFKTDKALFHQGKNNQINSL